MSTDTNDTAAAGDASRRLNFFDGQQSYDQCVSHILHLAGYNASDPPLVEDAFLRSLFPGQAEPPAGLLIDAKGAHYDPAQPSELEELLRSHPLDDSHLLNRARACIERLHEAEISQYSGFDPSAPLPDPGYVLVIDQPRGDASVTGGGADINSFREMLYYAQEDNPGARIVLMPPPEGTRGYLSDQAPIAQISRCADAASSWGLLKGATQVYTVCSQMGFEAILAGHRPHVYGRPFYAGWDLTQDFHPQPRRGRKLTRAQLFAAAMILYPVWYDPYRDQLCQLEDVIDGLEARARAWREDHLGWTATGMRLWKRKALNGFFGSVHPVRFGPAKPPRRQMVWAGQANKAPDAVRIEDGFLRSRGLGADLVPPLSLACDDLGIYYDPTTPSRLEHWITKRADLRGDQLDRARDLIHAITTRGLSKYNPTGPQSKLPAGRKILVPGQVEDDASIRLGCVDVRTNQQLLDTARKANPDAVILYKPHPDVLAGLRPGVVDATAADMVVTGDPAPLLEQIDGLWTMTSTLGFEALLHGVKVTTLGVPFYAGWGLTRDLAPIPERRRVQVSLEGLVHACLIDYPRYHDPVTGQACPAEVIVDRLTTGEGLRSGTGLHLLAWTQRRLSGFSQLWR
ncbi:capsular polysaccharide biosynthesis protein [Thalassovita sp.]|uniref:capsular polysaccharide biosynthesis protein n=1 Tax=Thalassovita sp. TaxID=1979401 RepID=UPI003B5B5535